MCPIYTGSITNMFKSKPPSEEEITFFRERKICLVCKGEVAGFNTYICPSCSALYCEKCAKALTLLENACWVCKRRIDPAKPVNITLEQADFDKSKKSLEKPKHAKELK